MKKKHIVHHYGLVISTLAIAFAGLLALRYSYTGNIISGFSMPVASKWAVSLIILLTLVAVLERVRHKHE